MIFPKIVALVPLRGGSKRIPRKNIKVMAGKPLAYWACAAAKACPHISDIYVSTDDGEIARTVESFDLDVRVLPRPKVLAADDATTDDVILHFMSLVDFDVVATIQATCPLVTGSDLTLAIEQFLLDGNDSLLTGVRVRRFFWTIDGRPLNYDLLHRPFSQDFEGSIMENGAFYLTKREALRIHRNRLGGKVGVFEMAEETATDIDVPADWETVARHFSERPNGLADQARKIKIIMSDFDGVWTDNKVYTIAGSREAVCCSKTDSLALEIFRARFELPVLVISKETNEVVAGRCSKLGLKVLSSVDDKRHVAEQELRSRGLSWAEVCYIGNDLNDLECMVNAGLALCPSDSVFEVKSKAHYILSHPGGNGAVREMLELLARYEHSAPRKSRGFSGARLDD
jgi:YrbI family 3-deoxy-D-manno-octulosonate 8-phosphate phosphatase